MNQIDSCKKCVNRTVSRERGILCSLTNEKPDFQDSCPSFIPDEIQVKREKRFTKSFNSAAVRREAAIKAISTGGPLFLIGLVLFRVPALNLGSRFIAYLGLASAVVGCIFLLYAGLNLFLKSDEERPTGKKQATKKDNDLEIY